MPFNGIGHKIDKGNSGYIYNVHVRREGFKSLPVIFEETIRIHEADNIYKKKTENVRLLNKREIRENKVVMETNYAVVKVSIGNSRGLVKALSTACAAFLIVIMAISLSNEETVSQTVIIKRDEEIRDIYLSVLFQIEESYLKNIESNV